MNLSTLPITELEHLLEEYPWFTQARKEYVARQSQMGDAALHEAMKDSALFFFSRTETLRSVKAATRREKDALIQEPVTVRREDAAPKLFVAGSDYFDRADYEELERSGEAFDTSALVFNPIASALNTINEQGPAPRKVEKEVAVKVGDDDFMYTETLASIYLKQEFYQRAIEVYEKLILIYPKKSAYFATLINCAKNIKQ